MSSATLEMSYKSAPDNNSLDHIPGDYGLPYIGKTLTVLKKLPKVIDHHYKTYGPVSRLRMAGQQGLLVVGPDLYKEIYLDKDKNFSARMGYDKSLGSMYPDNLLLQDFEDHRPLRRMFQTAFKNAAMRTYVDMMNPILEKNIKAMIDDSRLNFFESVKKTLMDVAKAIFYGIEDFDGPEAEQLTQAFHGVSEGLLAVVRKEIPGGKFKKGKAGMRFQQTFFKDLIQKRRGGNGTDIFSYLCNEQDDDGNYYADQDIINQATFLLFAAQDTTSSALTHMVFYTARHTEWQDRMRREVQSFGHEAMAYEDVDKLSDIELVFHESLRLRPSVPLMTRRTIRDCELGGYHIPANTVLFIPPTYNHRMPEFWDDPEKFDPERFNEERQEHKRHSFSYMPFGGGAHKCIGMHFANMVSKAFLFQFLQQYGYATPENYDPRHLYFPLPRPADGVPLTLTPLQ